MSHECVLETIEGQGLFFRKAGRLEPKARRLLQQIGQEQITSIKVVRTPVSGVITGLLNFASFGLFKLALKRLGYDNVYHLALWINGKYIFDKREVVKLEVGNPVKKGSEVMEVPLQGKTITINELIENTKSFMGDKKFSAYDARNNNCQVFVDSILSANGLNSPTIRNFVLQDAEAIFARIPSFVGRYGKQLTDLAAIGNRWISGEGIEEKKEEKNKLNKKSSTLNKTMSKSAILKELSQVEKSVKGGFLGSLVATALPILSDILFRPRGRGKKSNKEVDPKQVLGEIKLLKQEIKGSDDVSGGFLGSLFRRVAPALLEVAPRLLEGALSGRGIVESHAEEVKQAGGQVGVKPKRAPSKWIVALKEYNKGKSGYTVPKKGTKEYDEVRKIMSKL
jgi:hypothetical protein